MVCVVLVVVSLVDDVGAVYDLALEIEDGRSRQVQRRLDVVVVGRCVSRNVVG